MEARQLLQALRRVRHRSIAAVSTTRESTVGADLAASASVQIRAGVPSVSRPFGHLYLGGGRGLPHLRAGACNAASCQGAMMRRGAGCEGGLASRLAGSGQRRKFMLGSLAMDRLDLPHEESLAPYRAQGHGLGIKLLAMTAGASCAWPAKTGAGCIVQCTMLLATGGTVPL
jgi:hypothetical protein